VTPIPDQPALAPAPAVAAPDTSAQTPPQSATSSKSASSSIHKAARTPRAKAKELETNTKGAAATSKEQVAATSAAPAAAAAGESSTTPPPASGVASSADSAVPTVPIADRPVQASNEAEARHGITAGAWLLIGGLALGILGIAAMLRRRRRDESISIVDHSTAPRPGSSGTTIAHHP